MYTKKFKFERPIIESYFTPETIDVYWVERNNNSGRLKDIKEYKNDSWVSIFEQEES